MVIKVLSRIIIFSFLLNVAFKSAAQGRRVPTDKLVFNVNTIGDEKFGIIVLDHRPQVSKTKTQPESFMGYIRSLTGIAWPYFTKNDESLSKLIIQKISQSYQVSNVAMKEIGASAFYTLSEIEKLISTSECDKIIVFEWESLHFDGLSKIEYVVDVRLKIYTQQNEVVFDKNYVFKKPIPGSSQKFKVSVPEALSAVINEIFNSKEFVEAASSSIAVISGTAKKQNKSDVLMTKSGEELDVIVIEITKDMVKYKLANQLDGPIRNVEISKIFMIKYKNGDKEIFN